MAQHLDTSPARPAYAIAYLRNVQFGDDIIEYMEKVDATLAPYGGRFLVHGAELTPLEGDWDGDVVIVQFPDARAAQEWYDSPAYREILPLRTRNSDSMTALLSGVHTGYRATDTLARMLATS